MFHSLAREGRRTWYAIAERWRCASAWVATPVRDLLGHEASGGHTIAKHVNLPVATLRTRLVNEGLQQASAFWDLRVAQAAVNYAVSHELEDIVNWLLGGTLRRHTLTVPVPRHTCVGFGVSIATPQFDYPRQVRLVLERSGTSFFIVTAYPLA